MRGVITLILRVSVSFDQLLVVSDDGYESYDFTKIKYAAMFSLLAMVFLGWIHMMMIDQSAMRIPKRIAASGLCSGTGGYEVGLCSRISRRQR